MQRKGKVFVISGPSGTGKGTICKRLLEDDNTLELSTSMTTRPPRKGEIDGVHYHFVTVEKFQQTIQEGGLLEYANVYEKYYGTPKAAVLEKLDNGKDVLLEIDIQGAMQVKKSFPEGIFIFVLPPSLAELRKRIEGRATDAQDVIDLRMERAAGEIEWLKEYDYFIVNDDLEDAVATAKNIIETEHHRVDRDVDRLIEQYKEA